MQRLRLHYAKRGRLRFSSHRDFQRAFERALRRAAVPMAYSAGFSPHPKVSYAGAAPTGVGSEAEYLELALAEVVVPADVHAMLDEALPRGVDHDRRGGMEDGAMCALRRGDQDQLIWEVKSLVARLGIRDNRDCPPAKP